MITLGIIGVVAAMTMPTLMAQHRKQVAETRLKKFYSSINQAITLAEVTNGNKKDWDLSDIDTYWNTYLKPYLQYTKVENIQYSSEDDENSQDKKVVYLPDGSLFVFDIWKQSNGGHFIFYPEVKYYEKETINNGDVEYGTKAFRFGFWPNESDPKFQFHKDKGVEPYVANWDGEEESLNSNRTLGCVPNGSYCTMIIARNGWKIPKNYPKKF